MRLRKLGNHCTVKIIYILERDNTQRGCTIRAQDIPSSENRPVSNINNTTSKKCTVLYLEVSVLLEALPNSVNPKDPISVKTL